MHLTPEIYPLISTDDRKVERVNAPCPHRRCPPGECRAYSDETLHVTDADAAKAAELVAEGWWSTSRKSRTIARWKERPPTAAELFRPELLDTFHGRRLAKIVDDHIRWNYGTGRHENDDQIEHARLTPSLFVAFKAAGGDCGR